MLRLKLLLVGLMAFMPVLALAQPAAAHERGSRTYAALGDSVAAGYGLPASARARDEDAVCGRSAQAYPSRVARTENLELSHLACSGATAWNGLITDQETRSGEVQSQLQTLSQGDAPDVVSLTIGANDLGWQRQLQYCGFTTCGRERDTKLFERRLGAFRWELSGVVNYLNWIGVDKIVLTTYYDPVDGDFSCLEPERITPEESEVLRGRLAALNATISEVAGSFRNASVAEVDFTGHGVCSDDPWVFAPSETGALHPNAAGQRAIARAVAQEI